jgi:hypothetical protein
MLSGKRSSQLVAEIGALTDPQASELARRHGLALIELRNFPVLDATIGLFRITDGRSVDPVRRKFAAEAAVRRVQPNFRYLLQDQNVAPVDGDPAQYALLKLRLPQAQALARGRSVTVAVIDSGIDTWNWRTPPPTPSTRSIPRKARTPTAPVWPAPLHHMRG